MKMSDAELQAAVEEELDWEPGVNPAHVGVSAREGAVTLSGHVRTSVEKTLARKAALRVRGVRTVADEVEVLLAPEHRRDDEDIAEAIARTLSWNTAVPDLVKATVQQGVVRLTGTVDWRYQRRVAERAVRQVIGVRAVENAITVEPSVSPKDIKAKITEALHRQAQLEAGQIWVETSDGTAVLHGTVRSFQESESAERAAEAAPGIARVENRLEVVAL